MSQKTDRRCFLARGIVGAAGVGAAYASVEESILKAAIEDGSAQPGGESSDAKGDTPAASLPCGNIGDVSVSRLIIGGNLIGGWAHSRDLAYASKLFKSYNTEAKVFETLELAQANGINTIQLDPNCWEPIVKYNRSRSNKLQTIVCVSLTADKTKMNEAIKHQIDMGATMLYSHGGTTDRYMMGGGSIDAIGQMVDLIKAQGVPAGVGSHSLETPIACEKNGIANDFYMKTFHSDNYWSATPEEHREEYDWMQRHAGHNKNNDSMWCNNPEETATFMEKVRKPWLAFKVMAAGAIHPRFAFSYAFKNGADFIVAGMFDFQVEPDAELARDLLRKIDNRRRPWCA